MVKELSKWVTTDVKKVKGRTTQWLSQYYFFRDPARGVFTDSSLFLSPADGILVYQKIVQPDEQIIDIKGVPYSLKDAFRDQDFDQSCLIAGIFLTFFDVHVQRVPLAGRISYEELEPVDTLNHPMIHFENSILQELRIDHDASGYVRQNQRMVNTIYAPSLDLEYYVMQIADYDVDCITPFRLAQNEPRSQGERFSAIRYGSQVELVVPLDDRYDFEFIQETGWHVEGGTDPLIRITRRTETSPKLAEPEAMESSSACGKMDSGAEPASQP